MQSVIRYKGRVTYASKLKVQGTSLWMKKQEYLFTLLHLKAYFLLGLQTSFGNGFPQVNSQNPGRRVGILVLLFHEHPKRQQKRNYLEWGSLEDEYPSSLVLDSVCYAGRW